MINELIQTFLDNFNYLNTKNKRYGGGMFRDKGLIHALENISKKIREDLEALIVSKPLSEKDKTDKFFTVIKRNFDYAEVKRAEFGTIIKHSDIYNMKDTNGGSYQAAWKKPYPPSKFENELVKGLTAVNAEIDSKQEKSDMLNSIRERCANLINEIQNYQVKEQYLARVNPR